MPDYRSGACSACIWPYWYIFCGHTHAGDVNDIYRINLLTLFWERLKTLGTDLSPRDKASSWVYHNRIYIFGGYGTTPYTYLWDKEEDKFALEVMNDRGWNNQVLYFDIEGRRWVRVSCKGSKPRARAAQSTVLVGKTVYLFGGRHQALRLNDLYCLDMESLTWSGSISCSGPVPEARSWHTMSNIGKSQLILYGGFNNGNQPLDDVWLLNVASFSWTLLKQSTGFPRLWHTASVNSYGDLLIFGGCSSNIVDNVQPLVTSDLVILLRVEPFSLERLCIHALYKSKDITKESWETLPTSLQEWLRQRTNESDSYTPSYYKNNVVSCCGPGISQLALLTETEAHKLNDNKRYI
ncbi:kelch domain-containing protein 2-like isoform X1 [Physella acuta]|uniref:kelch domain-containing protein 2-like isoform X1 n=1 Tax=Physella acuta TaxID=109671 RepID=UPI0027DBBA59|nr:kelch domain-containing protein 2-like isoform X1 [Physella acuta]